MDPKEDDVKSDDFVARDYQVQLAEKAFEKNQIIFLPTGSGKTFISTLVLNHFLKKNDCATKKIGSGGKRGFFLVNTVALVTQQVEQIRSRSPFEVKGYCGDMGVDYWTKDVWDEELKNYGILVMTAQILLNLLQGSVVKLKDVAVMVFDECHHAVVDHPMRQIMQRFKNVPVQDQPRVLGLTATLLNKNVKVDKVDGEIRTLETTFLSQIATADDEKLVKIYSTNPHEYRVLFTENDTTQNVYTVRNRLFEEWIYFIKGLKFDEVEKPDKSIVPFGARQIEDRSKKTNKELKNVLEDIRVNMDDLGLYGGDAAVLARMIQMQKMMINCQSEIAKTAFGVFLSNLVVLRKYFQKEMGVDRDMKEKIDIYSSDKLKKLFGILKKMKEGDAAIVFVKRRFTAKIMHKIVSDAAKADPKLSHVKCDFIVGYNVTNPFKDTRENLLQRNYNNRVLDKFNSGLLNVLFGSNVVEEGMDILHCNMVVMFDAPLDFRSYTQSKGRARHAASKYIIMVSDPKYGDVKYMQFKDVENRLRELLCGGNYKDREEVTQDEVDATLFANIPGLEPYMPFGADGPVITALSAISHVNRYFLSLKTDKFTIITPYWFMEQNNGKFKCYLHLPMESKIRGQIEGTWQNNTENAKRSVALEACKRLHGEGELDDENLLPVTPETRTVNSTSLLPNWDTDETFSIGTKKNKRAWQKKWPECLKGCMPLPSKEVYLHVLQMRPLYRPPPDNHRLVVFHETVFSPATYAIISAKPLPQLAPFPLYLSTGEIEASVAPGEPRSFSQAELAKISKFHGVLFDQVIGVVNTFLIRDYSNGQNSFLIAPVVVDNKGIEINWEVMEQANKPFPDPDKKPSDEARKNLKINEENYLGMIVAPWYRTNSSTKYLVTRVCHDMTENSQFPSDNYATYKEYFMDKYKISPLQEGQPLLEVRPLSSRMNNLKPMALTKALRRSKNKEENEEFEVWLVPEFCVAYPVPGRWWVPAQVLPSVLHRAAQLCAAEELRMRLVRDVGIGRAVHPPGQPLMKLKADDSLAMAKHIPEVTQLLTPLTIQLKKHCAVSRKNTPVAWDEEEPRDIDRDMNVTVFDLYYYEEFVNQPLGGPDESTDEPGAEIATESGAPIGVDPDSATSEEVVSDSFSVLNAEATTSSQLVSNLASPRKRKLGDSSDTPPVKKRGNRFTQPPTKNVKEFVTPPTLKMMQKKVNGMGPEQVQVLQAITAAVANDFINCERLETLGDSFLKIAISLVLYETMEDASEGALTNLKGRIVGNKNLYFCGKNRQLGNVLEIKDFSPREDWVPPQYCVEHTILGTILDAELDPSCLYTMIIPKNEVELGELSSATRKKIAEILFNSEDLKHVQTCTFTNQIALADKNVSDAVEAVIGVYLENSGIFGALRVMNWFGVMDQNLATERVFTDKMTTPTKSNRGTPSDHLISPNQLEEIIQYKFHDRAYLLQALTHPSYARNNITQCYQRLEFLGDAIIDFLITIHIYERCTELHPGDLTDLRSALVNNITLGCITVRHGLHRFLLHRSSQLGDVMGRFARHQEERGHQIDNDILFLCEERETLLAEAIEVPKALGDIFEAIVGAVFLDSGKDFDVTWKLVYNLMKEEIEKFHIDVPKNHVRMLYESKCDPQFSSSVVYDGVVKVQVEVTHRGEKIISHGFGDNKYQAKRAAAKQALRVIRGSL